jgi:putative RNA 2'-phosphotransferase
MTEKERIKLSKKMSYALRHRPDEFGLELKEGGWVGLIELAKALGVVPAAISEVVTTPSDKVRFIIEQRNFWPCIRAAQGHSIDIDLQLKPVEPPDMLFHGTYVGVLDKIFDTGLKKMGRTHVHLSSSTTAAIEVGARRGKPVLIQVNSLKAHMEGIKFYLADNGVWLSDDIPPEYLTATYLK